MTIGWRVELPNWAGLPLARQRIYLLIVGDYGGEWWGQGRAEFDCYSLADACVRELDSELGLRPRVVFWMNAARRYGRA